MSGLNPYYASQLVADEELDCSPKGVTGKLCRTPIPGTVVVHIKLAGKDVARVTFAVGGHADVVLLSGDFDPDMWVAKETFCDHGSGEINVSLGRGEFPEGAVATADYEYEMF